MLRTAPTEERHASPQSMNVPWPPPIKPPAFRALPMSVEASPAATRTASLQAPTADRHPTARTGWASVPRMPAALWFWFGVYIAVNIGDLISTDIGLHAGLHEGNPLMRTLLAQHGFAALIVYKLVVIVAVVFGLSLLTRRHPRLAAVTLTICNILVALAVVLNIVQFAMI